MVELTGTVFSGEGKAAKFLNLEEYQQFLARFLGSKPFLGTLNLRVDKQELEELVGSTGSERLEGFEKDGRSFGGITVHPVQIEGIDAGLLEIDKTHYGDDVAEIVATQNLRDRLDLEDGESVKVSDRF